MEGSPKKQDAAAGLRLPAKATIYYIMTSALAKTVGILTTPIFTRILSSEGYGKYTLYMSILGLCTLISSSVISPSVIYRGLDKFKEKKQSFIFSAFACSWAFSALICLLLFAFSGFTGLEEELIAVLSIQLFCDGVIGLFQTVRRYSYNYRALSKTNALSLSLTPLLAIILILGGVGYLGRIYALLIVSLGISAVHLAQLLRLGKERFDSSFAKYIFSRTLPLLPSSLGTALGTELDKFMITAMLGAKALAKYSVAHTLGLGAGFAVSAVSASLYPWVIRKLSARESESAQPVFKAILISVGALGIAISALLPELFFLLAPAEYSAAMTGALPLIISTLPTFASGFITLGIVHAERGGYTFYSALASLSLLTLFNLIFIPRFEYFGAGLSLLLSSLPALFINYIFLKKCKNERIFSPSVFVKVLLVTVLGVALSYLAFEAPALRILLLTLPATMLLYAYSEIRELITEK